MSEKLLRLANVDPVQVARQVAQAAQDHLANQHMQLIGGSDFPQLPEPELTEIYRAVRTLAGYARGDHGLDAPVQEYLISLIPLYSACLGEGTRGVDGLVESEPETPLGLVIAAAMAREALAHGVPLTAPQVAVLAGIDRDRVSLLASRGEIPGAHRVDGARGKEWRFEARKPLREWLSARYSATKTSGPGSSEEDVDAMTVAVYETRAHRREKARGEGE